MKKNKIVKCRVDKKRTTRFGKKSTGYEIML